MQLLYQDFFALIKIPLLTTSTKPIVTASQTKIDIVHCKQHFSGSQVRVNFSVTMQIFDHALIKEIKNKQNTNRKSSPLSQLEFMANIKFRLR